MSILSDFKECSLEHSLIRILFLVFLIVGIIMAAMDLSLGGFSPIYWFLLSFAFLLVAICTEVLRIADHVTGKKK